jgi:hypothetical protein
MDNPRRVCLAGGSVRTRNRFASSAVVCTTACLLVSLTTVRGDDKAAQGAKPKTTVLFDGKSLDGWKKTNYANPGEVVVEEGAIVLKLGKPMTGITSTRRDLPRTDYELSYEAKRTSGRDFFAAATMPVGQTYITFVNGGWGGSVTGLSSLDGADASENETARFVKYEDKTWYKFRVRVTGEAVRCWVNDKEIVAVNIKERQVSTRIESRASQPLGFATWESASALRAITIRPLDAAEIAATNKFEE